MKKRRIVDVVPPEFPAEFFVPGRPRSKGSLRAFCLKNAAHSVRIEEQVAESAAWRKGVAIAAQGYMMKATKGLWNHSGPVSITLEFAFPRTVGVGGGIIPSHTSVFPTEMGVGDLDKLSRNILDALVDARLLADDRWVVDLSARKRWLHGSLDPGRWCGCWITVVDSLDSLEDG